MWRVVLLGFLAGFLLILIGASVDGLGGLQFAGITLFFASVAYAAMKNPKLWQ